MDARQQELYQDIKDILEKCRDWRIEGTIADILDRLEFVPSYADLAVMQNEGLLSFTGFTGSERMCSIQLKQGWQEGDIIEFRHTGKILSTHETCYIVGDKEDACIIVVKSQVVGAGKLEEENNG